MGKNRKNKKKNKKTKMTEIKLDRHSTEQEIKQAILFAYFDSTKPEKNKHKDAFDLLFKLFKYNIIER